MLIRNNVDEIDENNSIKPYDIDIETTQVDLTDVEDDRDDFHPSKKYGTRVAELMDAIRYIQTRNEVFNDIKEFTCSYNQHDGSWNLEVESR